MSAANQLKTPIFNFITNKPAADRIFEVIHCLINFS